MLSNTIMFELNDALVERMCIVHLKYENRGSINSAQKFKSLQGPWFIKDENKEKGGLVEAVRSCL